MRLLAKRVKDRAFTAIVPDEQGLAIACVVQDGGSRPMLLHARHTDCAGGDCDANFLKKQIRSLHIANYPCTTTMSLGEYTILSVDAPDVPPAELRAAVRWQIKDLIDFHIDDAVLDVFDAPASGADQRRHNLYVVVARLNSVKQHISVLQEAELKLTTIDIPELVIRNLCALCPDDKNGVVFVYLAQGKGVLTVTKDATLYLARSLDFGYETLFHSAAGSASHSADEVVPEYDRLVLEVQRSLDFYDRCFSQPAVARILISPTWREIPGLAEYLSSNTGIAASVFDVNDIIDMSQPLTGNEQAACLLAIGAALRQEKKTL
jgi:MSHA biogenesis protein MshI